MFHQRRRTIFLFVCLLVFIQAAYYTITLRLREPEPTIINVTKTSKLTVEPNSTYRVENQTNSTYKVENQTNPTNLQTNSTLYLTLTAVSNNLTLNTSFTESKINLSTTTTLPQITIPFFNASLYLSFNSTKYDFGNLTTKIICNFSTTNNDTSIYKIDVNQKLSPYFIIEEHHGNDLYPGGHFLPKTCQSEQRLALIICYRNREQHLRMFLDNIHPFLKKQQLDYTIFVVNQHGNDQFNRAALFNVGYLEAMKLYQYDCFIFHDVDLLPEDLRNVYKCGNQPRHMSVAVDKFNYKLLYSSLFGGVTAFDRSDFIQANGYPTVYWGWGGEDDDMYLRVVKKLHKSITRYPIEIARYKMIRTHDHTSSKLNPHRHTILYSKYDYNLDGINTTNYTLHNITFYKLFTLVNVSLFEESFDKVRQRLKITEKTKPK